MIDLGDVYPATVTVKDANGNPANATLVQLTFTLPDGTLAGPFTVTGTVGVYAYDYAPTQVGMHGVRWVATGINASAYLDAFAVGDNTIFPIIGLSDLKSYLRITYTTDDENLRLCLIHATSIAERYCHRALRRKTLVETFAGSFAGNYITLHQPPVISLVSVVENGAPLNVTTDCVVDARAGLLYRGPLPFVAPWSIGVDNIVVTYIAGYANPPATAQRGVMELVRHLWGQSQESNGSTFAGINDGADYSGISMGYTMPNRVVELLAPLRMPGIG